MRRSVSAFVLATALAVMLTVAGTAEAGKRRHHHYGRHSDGDLASWFAFGSLVTFLAVTSARHHAPPPPPPRRHWHAHGAGYRHVHHAHHGHSHIVHRHGRYAPRHRRPAPAPRFLSDRHRHGAGPWHVHALGHPRARHRH